MKRAVGISAFSQSIVNAIDAFDRALLHDDVMEAITACQRLLEEIEDARDRLTLILRSEIKESPYVN